METLDVIYPATGEKVGEYNAHTPEQVQQITADTRAAQQRWKNQPLESRLEPLRKLGVELRHHKQALARLITQEMGKRQDEAVAEIEKCASACDYYAERAPSFLADQKVDAGFRKSYVTFQPMGVILAIMPWNFPFWQVIRCAAPALAAGNGIVLKHASNTPGCALAIEEMMHKAGFPPHLFSAVLISSKHVEALIADPDIAAVTLTGSTLAGKKVAEIAGRHLKKTVLELGGSDPYVILSDADLEHAATTCTQARLLNAGQSCIAAKRFIVTRENYYAFVDLLKTHFEQRRMGDPHDEETTLAPLARKDLRDELHHQVRMSLNYGAQLITGGELPGGEGAFYPATLLANVTPDLPAYKEELFGPVGAVIEAENDEAAIRIANETVYGLGSAIFTRDIERGEMLARNAMEAGACFVNDFVRSDPKLPFGGIKQSGYGRELALFGMQEFLNIKTIAIADPLISI